MNLIFFHKHMFDNIYIIISPVVYAVFLHKYNIGHVVSPNQLDSISPRYVIHKQHKFIKSFRISFNVIQFTYRTLSNKSNSMVINKGAPVGAVRKEKKNTWWNSIWWKKHLTLSHIYTQYRKKTVRALVVSLRSICSSIFRDGLGVVNDEKKTATFLLIPLLLVDGLTHKNRLGRIYIVFQIRRRGENIISRRNR